jgi:DNA-binding NarL/FixJ family response regulator
MAYPDVVSHDEERALSAPLHELRELGEIEPDDTRLRDARLSDDDLLLLAELAKGVTVDRVGRRLDVSGRTVRRRLRGICDRIGVATAIEAVAWAARRRLI